MVKDHEMLRLPRWPSGKESTANAGDTRDVSSIPGLGRYPGEGNGNPIQYSCLEKPTDRGDWQATIHGVTKELVIIWQINNEMLN